MMVSAYEQKPVTFDDLMALYDELQIIPDAIVLRLLMTKDGKYILTRVDESGQLHPSLALTDPLSLEGIYQHLMRMWLQAFKEED